MFPKLKLRNNVVIMIQQIDSDYSVRKERKWLEVEHSCKFDIKSTVL